MMLKLSCVKLVLLYTYLASILLGMNKGVTEGFKKNSLYIEIGGQAIGLSLNYELRYKVHYTFRTGISYMLLGFGIPVSFNYISGEESSNHIEIGMGVTYAELAAISWWGSNSEPSGIFYFTPIIGYRYQRPNGGFVFRLSFTPIITITEKEQMEDSFLESSGRGYGVEKAIKIEAFPYGGVSIGYCF